MPEIARHAGFRLYVYPGDHPPPHVHVRFEDFNIKVSLVDLRILGTLKIKEHLKKEILKVVKSHRDKALKVWEELNEQGEEINGTAG